MKKALIVIVVLAVAGIVWAQDEAANAGPARQLQACALGIDRLNYIIAKLAENKELKPLIEAADKEWQSKIDTMAQQSRIINEQNAKIAAMQKEIEALKKGTEQTNAEAK